MNEKNFISVSGEEIEKNIFPKNIDMALGEEKKLVSNGKLTTRYVNILGLYKTVLEEVFEEKTEWSTLNQIVLDSDLNFPAIEEQNQTIYQKTSLGSMDFFYLRNNIYVERLTGEQLAIFDQKLAEDDLEITEDLKKIVEETFELVSIPYLKAKSNTEVPYNSSGTKTAKNNAIIIEVGYQREIDETGNYLNKETEDKRRQFIADEIAPKLKKSLETAFNRPVQISIYAAF